MAGVTAMDVHGLARSDGTRAHIASESPEISVVLDKSGRPAVHSHYDDESAHVRPGPASRVGGR